MTHRYSNPTIYEPEQTLGFQIYIYTMKHKGKSLSPDNFNGARISPSILKKYQLARSSSTDLASVLTGSSQFINHFIAS